MIPFDEAVELDVLRDDLVVTAPVKLHGHFTGIGESVAVIGSAEVQGKAQCARCLHSFDISFTSPLQETFVRKGNLQEHADEEEGVDFFTYEGEAVDMAPAAASSLYLDMPMRFVCKGGCKGLCPVCGIDLNEQTCSCGENDDDNPFSALRALYPDE